jgi:hypothetical protein
LAIYPDLHVYHFAPYEPAALKRLMGRYATRENEVDNLLRAEIFVDLFAVVRHSTRASVESYSIKKLEHRPTNASARGAGGLHAVRRCGLIDHLWGCGGQLVSIDHFRHELLMQLRNAADLRLRAESRPNRAELAS